MAQKYVMINDIIAEHNTRMQNLRKYYPFFVLADTAFAQYKEGKYSELDMGYITMAVLRFFIEENNFNESEVTYSQYEEFMVNLLDRDFEVDIDKEDLEDLILYIFDKIRNDGKAFEFHFYDPGNKQKKTGRVRLIDSRISDGRVVYFITAEGIEFYLDTKEVRDESKINVEQLLLEKMITGENFRGGIDVVKRINSEVNRLIAEKDEIVDMLGYDVFAGAAAYEEYMNTVGKWFSEEQKLFAKNKALIDKAVAKAGFEKMTSGGGKAFEEINELELLLKKTILKHGGLINSTMELQKVSDNIIHKAKLKKLKPSFDFGNQLFKIIREDRPERLFTILSPLFAPKLEKSFSFTSIDKMLTMKSEEEQKTTRVKKEDVDTGFLYEDELLDEKIGNNFGKLFYELMDQISKWGRLTLKEFNGILEIKFGKEIYENIDYYAFLTHLAQKSQYDISSMLKKQDTMLEGIVVESIKKQSSGKTNLGAYAPDISFEGFRDLKFSITFDNSQEIYVGEDTFITDMVFHKI